MLFNDKTFSLTMDKMELAKDFQKPSASTKSMESASVLWKHLIETTTAHGIPHVATSKGKTIKSFLSSNSKTMTLF